MQAGRAVFGDSTEGQTMSACDHWDGFSHCTECCDEQTGAAYRLIGEQKAELATTRQMLRDTAQSLQDEENENTRLTEALELAKRFMRHHPACAWIADYGSVLVIGRVADCSCGHTAAMEKVVLALPRPTVVIECGDTSK